MFTSYTKEKKIPPAPPPLEVNPDISLQVCLIHSDYKTMSLKALLP